jgi:hypothetical protein
MQQPNASGADVFALHSFARLHSTFALYDSLLLVLSLGLVVVGKRDGRETLFAATLGLNRKMGKREEESKHGQRTSTARESPALPEYIMSPAETWMYDKPPP